MSTLLKQIDTALMTNVCHQDGLLGGKLGLVLYCACASKRMDEKYLTKAEAILYEVVDALNQDKTTLRGYSLAEGLAGLAFMVSFLEKERYLSLNAKELLTTLDEQLYDCALADIRRKRVDLLYQAGGVLHYFAYRLPEKSITEIVVKLVKELSQHAILDEKGFRYDSNFTDRRKGMVDLGLAHGLTGLLLTLCNICKKEVAVDEIKPVLNLGLKFILHCKQTDNQQSLYPVFTKPDGSCAVDTTRLAWCYGDLNILLLFHRLYDVLGDKQILHEIELLETSLLLRKDPGSNAIEDAHFCHGASGVAAIFQQLHQINGRKAYEEAYQYWLAITQKLLERDLVAETFRYKKYGVLEGLVGPALVLLESTTQTPLGWSRILLAA